MGANRGMENELNSGVRSPARTPFHQGTHTMDGLFVRPRFVVESQYSVFRNRAAWPSRNVS